MNKTSIAPVLVFALLITFASVAIAQAEKGWEKTLTLPSGEVILDMSGEWAVSVEHHGTWAKYGTIPDIAEIKQEGTSFVGVTLLGSPRKPKGSKTMEGELDETGFKKVQIFTRAGPLDLKGKILSNGNRIILDDGEKIRLTLIRR